MPLDSVPPVVEQPLSGLVEDTCMLLAREEDDQGLRADDGESMPGVSCRYGGTPKKRLKA